jgi:hypothetical protein
MSSHDIDERAAGVFAPDTLLATQYFGRIRRRKDLTGEQRLMFAVIEQAVEEYMKHAAATDRHHRELFVEAEAWIESQDRSRLYAFDTICEYLGLEGDHVRQGLRRWKLRARGEEDLGASIEVVRPPDDRRASNE